MAEEREPPPFGEEEALKEEDDLFSDATEADKAGGNAPASLEVNLDDKEEKDNPFESAHSEVNLDSDEDVGGAAVHEQEPEPVAAPVPAPRKKEEEKLPQISVSQTSTASSKVAATTKTAKDEEEEKDNYEIEIRVTDPYKQGDGMGAYIVYRIITKTTIPAFRRSELSVVRRFSDFLGLHEKLAEKYVHLGIIVPPPPEKSVIGMTKVKMSKEESSSNEFLERRRAALERYLNRTSTHRTLRDDPDFREFLEKDGDLPKATSTSALSGASVMRLFHKVGDAVEKISFRMDETDEWFEEKHQQIEALDQQLRKLHTSLESLAVHRRELSQHTAVFAKSAAMLGSVEEHTALSRALSQLAETEEKIEQLYKEQSESDLYTMAELMKDYIALLGAVKEVLHERVKCYKVWKDAEATLGKKRENKAKLEIAHKTDKIPGAQQEISEWEQKVEKGQEDFEKISQTIRKEIARFEKYRVVDFKNNVIKYLEGLMDNQQKLIKYWEAFLPEAKAIA